MNGTTYLAVGVLALSLLCPVPVKAMSLLDFGKLNDDDEASYVTFLIEGAAKMLREHHQPDQADRAIALFKDTSKSGGVNQMASNIRELNTLNNRNATNPNNRAAVYGIEDALARTLKDANIVVPVDYLMAIGKDFKPAGPPRHAVILPSNDR
jgi:hypothetical protein